MASKPTVHERVREHICPNCGKAAVRSKPNGPAPVFCSPACRVEMNNRLTVEGRAVIAFLKAWRRDRGTGDIAKQSFGQVCEIVGYFNSEDHRLGRPSPDYQAAALLAQGLKYFDRRRPQKEVDQNDART